MAFTAVQEGVNKGEGERTTHATRVAHHRPLQTASSPSIHGSHFPDTLGADKSE